MGLHVTILNKMHVTRWASFILLPSLGTCRAHVITVMKVRVKERTAAERLVDSEEVWSHGVSYVKIADLFNISFVHLYSLNTIEDRNVFKHILN
jgi:hypothetical protein